MIYLDLPANGRFDITVVASQEISEVQLWQVGFTLTS